MMQPGQMAPEGSPAGRCPACERIIRAGDRIAGLWDPESQELHDWGPSDLAPVHPGRCADEMLGGA